MTGQVQAFFLILPKIPLKQEWRQWKDTSPKDKENDREDNNK